MWKVSLAVVALGLVASGCGGYVEGSEEYSEDLSAIEEVDSMGEAAVGCANPEGANFSMAALAVAAANELKRWDHTDFAVVKKYNYSMAGNQEVVDLSGTGRNLCTANGGCTNIQAVLDLQKKEASGKVKFPGGQTLQSDVFAQRLVAALKAQQTCNGQPKNLCPAEAHVLSFVEAKQGTCEYDYYYKVGKAGAPDTPLDSVSLLKNRMIMYGSLIPNPFLNFDNVSPSVVRLDPSPNTVVNGIAYSGVNSCYMLGGSNFGNWSTDKSGQACCMGTAPSLTKKKLAKQTWSTTYHVCQ